MLPLPDRAQGFRVAGGHGYLYGNHTRHLFEPPIEAELESIKYLDEVLQAEDIWLVENVQRGMETPAFTQGRIVHDPGGSGKSEHAVHHFHGLVLDAYRSMVAA